MSTLFDLWIRSPRQGSTPVAFVFIFYLTLAPLLVAQNCGLPRIVDIFPENANENLTETAVQGAVLARIKSANIQSDVSMLGCPGTQYVDITVENSEVILTLASPLKNFLDDSRNTSLHLQTIFRCADGLQKAVQFRIPFRDENTKVPRFSSKIYKGQVPLDWPSNDPIPLQSPIVVTDEDRDEINAQVCVHTAHSAILVRTTPFQMIPTPALKMAVPEGHQYTVSIYLQDQGLFRNIRDNPLRVKIVTWNREAGKTCDEPPKEEGLTDNDVAYVDLDIEEWIAPTTWSSVGPIPTTTPMPNPDCSTIEFTYFSYQVTITTLDGVEEDTELEHVQPSKVQARSSAGYSIRYSLEGLDYLTINSNNGKIFFTRSLTPADIPSNYIHVLKVGAIDEVGHVAITSLVLVFNLAGTPSTPTEPTPCSTSTPELECPVCPTLPTPIDTTTQEPDVCPSPPPCPTPEPCPTPTEPPQTTDQPIESSQQPTKPSEPPTPAPTEAPTHAPTNAPTHSPTETHRPTEPMPTTSISTTSTSSTPPPPVCEGDELLPHPDCTKYYHCVYGVPIVMPCADNLYFNPRIGVCDWPSEVPECVGGTRPPIHISTLTTETITTQTDSSVDKCSPCECSYSNFTCPEGGGLHANPYSCTSFYACLGEKAIIVDCPKGQDWCQDRGHCDYQGSCSCKSRKEPPCCDYCPCDDNCVPPSSSKNLCTGPGSIRDPDQCGLFHKCQDDGYGKYIDCTMECPKSPVSLIFCPEEGGVGRCVEPQHCDIPCDSTCPLNLF